MNPYVETGENMFPPPQFPGPGKGPVDSNNGRSILGFSCGFFECPTPKPKRLTPLNSPGATPRPIPAGPTNGTNRKYPLPYSGPIGGAGADTCIIVVVRCANGAAVYHFRAGDDPITSMGGNLAGCDAIICGGNNTERESNCLGDAVADALRRNGANVIATVGGQGCGFNPDGTWYEVP